jgi:hypothetical protein
LLTEPQPPGVLSVKFVVVKVVETSVSVDVLVTGTEAPLVGAVMVMVGRAPPLPLLLPLLLALPLLLPLLLAEPLLLPLLLAEPLLLPLLLAEPLLLPPPPPLPELPLLHAADSATIPIPTTPTTLRSFMGVPSGPWERSSRHA